MPCQGPASTSVSELGLGQRTKTPECSMMSPLRAAKRTESYLVQNIDNWGYEAVFGVINCGHKHRFSK